MIHFILIRPVALKFNIMRRSENLAYIEKGYGFFPYLIIRKRSGIYFQLPIHRHFNKRESVI